MVSKVSWPVYQLPDEDRRSVIGALMVSPSSAAIWRFAVLMLLSSLVAAIGLLQNSAAVVIGAMMIAPLMSPIMGIASCLIMGWGHRLLGGLALVSVSVAGAVAVGWFFAVLLPPAGTGLPAEVVARSSPDIRDLLVALAAGAAGAIATVHKQISVALPGVAVAVAIVPPLAAIGVLLGRGQPELARGAALLFLTNLVGIVLMAAVVFLLTGIVPGDTFRTRRGQILTSLAIAALCALAVALILTPRFIAVTRQAHELKVATQTITDLLDSGSRLSRITTSDNTIRADITGPTAPPPIQKVAATLSRALGHPVTVQLGWIPMRDPKRNQPDTPQLPLNELSPLIEKWLAAQSLSLKGLSYESGTLVVSTAGPHPPKSSENLTTLIRARYNQRVPVSLAWTRTPGTIGSNGGEAALTTARDTADKWASSRPGTTVLSVDGSSAAVTVTLIGQTQPDVVTLRTDLQTALPQAAITIQWVSGGLLVVATPTSTPTPTAGPTPTTSPATTPPR
ncbi:hypothetical protein AWC06_12195 [Mycobacterium fragae]|uniref:DUF389 domain-containing protein n=2 Tax=Mycobacterium fragae TaxID=1260918 RepID=A0A1X1UX81_9MYCO|nr:hypothetical protein AWC06_12195 [Mycobacterium fragae]